MHHLSRMPRREGTVKFRSSGCQDLVRFFALLRIKPHAPPLVRVPVNSFEFHSCECTPQVEYLLRLLRPNGCFRHPILKYSSFTAWTTRVSNPVLLPTLSSLNVSYRPVSRLRHSVFLLISTHFTATLGIPYLSGDSEDGQFPKQSRG